MIEKKRRCAAFAVCGSFCTLEAALDAARALRGQGWELLPVMSFAAGQDTRFGRASGWRHQLEGLTGRPVLDTLQAVEPLGPRHLADALVIAPCTGGHAGPAGRGPFRHAGDAGGEESAPGGLSRRHRCLDERRAGRFRGEHRPALPAQALLFCALRAG